MGKTSGRFRLGLGCRLPGRLGLGFRLRLALGREQGLDALHDLGGIDALVGARPFLLLHQAFRLQRRQQEARRIDRLAGVERVQGEAGDDGGLLEGPEDGVQAHPLLAETALAGIGVDAQQDFVPGVAADVVGQLRLAGQAGAGAGLEGLDFGEGAGCFGFHGRLLVGWMKGSFK